MDVLKNLLGSEQGLLATLLIVGATVLTAIGKMPVADWTSYSEWLFGLWGGTHAAVSVAGAISSAKAAPVAPTVVKPAS